MGKVYAMEPKIQREMDAHLPGLLRARHLLLEAMIQPVGITMPLSLKPEGEPPTGSFLMGLPVTWSAEGRWGLIVGES